MVKIIRWTKEADGSYQEMIAFIMLTWNEKIVARFVKETFTKLNLISENPEIYIAIGNTNLRRVLIHPNVSLVYKINSEFIDVLLFFDNRSKPDVRKF